MVDQFSALKKRYMAVAFILLGFAVLLGAFGSHYLKENISTHYLAVYKTANLYHFIHSLGWAFVIFILPTHNRKILDIASLLFFLGILLFSGSLYILSIADLINVPSLKIAGAITPFGGLCFVASWFYSAYILLKK